jgi:hypothetical protein
VTTPNPESILDTVKKALGFDPDYTAFDLDITMFINAAFGSLKQLGVGSDTGFIISDNTTLWTQYITDLTFLGMVKSYIFMSVRLAFDPPATSFGIAAFEKQLEELGWRINVAAEHANPPSDPFSATTAESEVMRTTIAPKVVRLAIASTFTPDASAGNMFYLTMTDDCAINAPSAGTDGEHITLEITSNGHSVTSWGAGWDFGDAGAPTLSGVTIVSAYYNTAAASWRAGSVTGF